ncbi:protein translocase subunit SecF [Candidatus Parcubacteria bacterium]|nr:protein translocase subunit SecF [Candidatus Parcubacteria bacterium]
MASISNNMFVVRYRKIWFTLSALLIALSVFGIVKYGFKESVDFKGGTITEVKYVERPDQLGLESQISELNLGGFSVRPSGETNYIIRTKELDDKGRSALSDRLGVGQPSGAVIERQNTIGPVAGAELKGKAFKAIAVVVIMIVLFVTFAFRKVSQPVSSWKYGLATVVALFHDVLIPTGVFVFLGHYMGTEIDLLFVTGLLAILGYSVHDTIVVFDRVRENLRLNREGANKGEDFEITVGKSVKQTFGRSINTSLTIFITLLALYLFGSVATKDFALLLIVGIIVGTYSSIFVASPLLVTFQKWSKK